MFTPKTYDVVEENGHIVTFSDGSERHINAVIWRFHCAQCLSTLEYKEGHHGVTCARCGGQSFITNRDQQRYIAWAEDMIETDPGSYISEMLELGLQARMEDIEYRITHISSGNGPLHPLPEHLMKRNQ